MANACKSRFPMKTVSVNVREIFSGTYCSILSTRVGFQQSHVMGDRLCDVI